MSKNSFTRSDTAKRSLMMNASKQHCSSGFAHSSSSSESLSSPTYSLRENREGELVSLTSEMVHWPERPVSGKYSEVEEKKSRRKARQAASKRASLLAVQAVASDIVGPGTQPITVDSDVLNNSNLIEWAMKRTSDSAMAADHRDSVIGIIPRKIDLSSSSILGPEALDSEALLIKTDILSTSYDDLLSWASHRNDKTKSSSSKDKNLMEAVDGTTYALLGKCSPEEALLKLGSQWAAVLFQYGGKLHLGLLYDHKKYILPLIEVKTSRGTNYGISKDGSKPEVSFFNLEKLVHFYSLHPLTAFLHF